MLLVPRRAGISRASTCGGVWVAAAAAAAATVAAAAAATATAAVNVPFSPTDTSISSFLNFPPPATRRFPLSSRFLAQHRAALSSRSLLQLQQQQQQLQQQQQQQQQQNPPVPSPLYSTVDQSGVQGQGAPFLSSSLPEAPEGVPFSGIGAPSRAPEDTGTEGAPLRLQQEQQQLLQEQQQQLAAAAMAWRSHGRTNSELIENLRRSGLIKDQRVYNTMLQVNIQPAAAAEAAATAAAAAGVGVDRGKFISVDPYIDRPQSIGFNATISAPHIHAISLEELKDKLTYGKRALDVGSGTGYLTVCMAMMVGAGEENGGIAIGIDYIQGLVDLSKKNVTAGFPHLMQSRNFALLKGDGWAGGPSWGAPYDAIHVGAAAAAVPAALLQQLAIGGKMVIPVECHEGLITLEGLGDRQIDGDCDGGQALVVISKNKEGAVSVKYITSVVYVPLVRQTLEGLMACLASVTCWMKKKVDPRIRECEQQQQQQQQQQQLKHIIDKLQHAPPLDALVKLCVTPQQATAVIAFLDCLCSCSSFRSKQQQQQQQQESSQQQQPSTATAAPGTYQTIALTAARGRGKSAALGLAVAAAVSLGVSSTFVCAPSAENVQTLFEFVQKGLLAMGMREQIDFQVSIETVGSTRRGKKGLDTSGVYSSGLYDKQDVKAITKIEVYRHHKQRVQFIFPHERQTLVNCDLLVIDEAASIPLPVVKGLLGPYTVLLSSTVNGYEGTGRSLSLKLLGDLRKGNKLLLGEKGEKGDNKSILRRQLKEITLDTPIRYAEGDPVESWLNQLLCLDCTEAPPLDPQ
ncbi:UPF0202 family protein, putative, partial [Eimeria maxima]